MGKRKNRARLGGFPVFISYKKGFFIMEFPEGYAPNGSQTNELKDRLIRHCGGLEHPQNEVSDTLVKVKMSPDRIASLIHGFLSKNNYPH